MSCRHDLANTTCVRCYPDRGGLDSNGRPQIDPGPGPHAPNMDGPGAAPPQADELACSLKALRAEMELRIKAARALFDLGHLQPEHIGGCPEDEPCDCPEYVLVGAVMNDEIRADEVELAICAAEDVSDVT